MTLVPRFAERLRRLVAAFGKRIVVVCLFYAIGCDGVTRFPVEGLMTLDGIAVEDAAITFMPAAGGRPGLASTDATGRFAIREAGMVDGLVPGRYRVVVLKAIMSRRQTVRGPAPGPHPEGQPVPIVDIPVGVEKVERYIVPERYTLPETSGLEVSVSGPTKNLVFSLKTEP